MKILLLGPYNSPIIQRLKFNLEEIGGHEVWVATYNKESDPENRILSMGELNSFLGYLNFFKFNKIARQIKPDVIHAHIINHYGLMALFQKTPLVIAIWGSEVMIALNSKNYFKRAFFKVISFLVASKASAIHTSSAHIKAEMNRHFNDRVTSKIKTFYWGFPVSAPTLELKQELNTNLLNEFNIPSSNLLVFTRGLAPTYNPELMAKIIKKLLESKIPFPIVVLKGFSTDEQIETFKNMLAKKWEDIIFIDRLLSSEELHCLYSHTKFHFSVPYSDALGGGVIEPVQLGSIPILSNIPPYREYIQNNEGFILQDDSNASMNSLDEFISLSDDNKNNQSEHISHEYSTQNIISQINEIYTEVTSNHSK